MRTCTELIGIGSLSLKHQHVSVHLTNRHWVEQMFTQRNSDTMSHNLELIWRTTTRVDKDSLVLISECIDDVAHDCRQLDEIDASIESQWRDTTTGSQLNLVGRYVTWPPSTNWSVHRAQHHTKKSKLNNLQCAGDWYRLPLFVVVECWVTTGTRAMENTRFLTEFNYKI